MKRIVIGVLATCIVLMLPMAGNADPTSVPHFLNYQSLLYDDGGNLLANGPAGITFKITDAAGNVLYEERQTPDVVNGAVSAVIGNGLDGGGAPMGGIPASVLTPDSSRYLEVTVDGYPAESSMEIVSVPYAVYAEKALGAADGAIGGAALANKSITIDHLADGLISDLATQMGTAGLIATRTDLTNLQTTYRGSAGASTIGVTAGFVYSGSNNLQGVLQDLDRAIQSRQAGLETVQTNITNETNTRISSDSAEVAARGAADSAEAAARAGADAAEAATRRDKDENHEGRIVALEGKEDDSPIPAWGTATCGVAPSVQGRNVSISYIIGAACRISFVTPLANAIYAVTVTPQNNLCNGPCSGTGGLASPLVVSDKTTDGFTVGLNFSTSQSFDFIVVGPL